MSRSVPWLTILCLVVGWLLAPASARAWPHEGTEVHPGMIYRHLSGPIEIPGSGVSDQEIFILYVDTWSGAISFVATRPGDRGITVSTFAERYGVQGAINTNFFGGGFNPCGLMVGEGEVWGDAYHHVPGGRCSDSVGFSEVNRVSFFDSWDLLHGPPPDGLRQVVTGMPTVVRDGAVVDEATITSSDYPSHMATAQPRTALCWHEDRRTVALVVVDGRASGRIGMRGITLGRFLRHNLGCRRGVAFDGGGSSTMFVRGQPGYGGRPAGIVNRTSDGSERAVCCHLGVRVDPDGAMWRAEWVEQSPYPDVEAGALFELWVRYRNLGRRTWRAGGDWPVRLGTDEPQDRESPFFLDGDWISPSRPTAVESETPPGEVGTFRFTARAPDEPGTYRESFNPVAEGGGWMRPTWMFWDITVTEPGIGPDGDADADGDFDTDNDDDLDADLDALYDSGPAPDADRIDAGDTEGDPDADGSGEADSNPRWTPGLKGGCQVAAGATGPRATSWLIAIFAFR